MIARHCFAYRVVDLIETREACGERRGDQVLVEGCHIQPRMGDRGRRAERSCNVILTRVEHKRLKAIHRKKLRTIKCSVDNSCPASYAKGVSIAHVELVRIVS